MSTTFYYVEEKDPVPPQFREIFMKDGALGKDVVFIANDWLPPNVFCAVMIRPEHMPKKPDTDCDLGNVAK